MADKNVVPMVKPKQGPDPMLDMEMGIERVLPFSPWATEREVVRNEKIAIDDLVEMRRRDGQARALARLFILPIMAALQDSEWIEPEVDGDEDSEDNADDEVEFANNMWNLPPQAGGMSTSKTKLLRKTLQALTDGFAVFEEVRHVPEDGPLKGKITLRKLAYRDPRTLRFRVDEKGGFDGVRQVASNNGKTVDVRIPKEKVWYWAANEEENPFYGISYFESAYYHYEIKRKLYYIAHLAAQFAAVPGRVGEVPAGADPREVQAFKQSLMNFAFNTAMAHPFGYKVTPFNGNTNFKFIELIDHHNHMMAKSVIASFLDNEQRAALIEIGKVDPNADFFVMALESIMDDIAESWSTYLMPKYIDWNFGTKKYPVFRFGQLTDSTKDVIKEIFQVVVTSSVLNSTPEFVRELEKKLSKKLGLDIDYDEIEETERQVAEEQKAKQEEEMAAQQQAQQQAVEQGQTEAGPPGMPGAPGQQPPPGAPPRGGPPMGQPGQQPPFVAASANGHDPGLDPDDPSIDDLVRMASDLLSSRPEPEPSEV